MTGIRRLGLLVCLLVALAPAWGRAAEWRPMPWHLVDYFYQLPPVEHLHTATIDVTVSGRLDGSDKVFIAPLWGRIGATSFYFGLQTHLVPPAGGPAAPGLIFSRWGAVDRGDARVAPGGWDAALTDQQSGEGNFVSVRLPYGWGPGRHTFLLNNRTAAEGGFWLDLLMFDHQARRWIDVGSLRVAEGDARMHARPASFVEIYGRPPAPGGSVEQGFSVTFHPLRVNGNVTPLGGGGAFDQRVPRLAEVAPAGAGIAVTIRGAASPPH